MTPGPKSLALVREAETTTALPAEGISMILRPGWARSGGAPAWTCLASGTERLMKLTIGLTAEADGNPWPTAKIRQVNGHRLATLRPDVDRALGERISGVAAP